MKAGFSCFVTSRPLRCIAGMLLAGGLFAGAIRAANAQPWHDGIPPGPHPVGFRVIEAVDYTRSAGPKRDFTGTVHPDNAGYPVPIYLWYPAADESSGTPMTYGAYRRLKSYGGDAAADSQTVATALKDVARYGFKKPITDDEVRSILQARTAARRDTRPADGSFPLVLGGLYGPTNAVLLAEHLASHGYVVATGPMPPDVAALQVSDTPRAIETQSRTMEFVRARVRGLSFVASERMGLIGNNFEGLTALNVQFRQMQADAVVSLDGWEGGGAAVEHALALPRFDVLRMRVPYLLFRQDNAPTPRLEPDLAVFDTLRYAERRFYVVRGHTHAHYVTDVLTWPSRRAEVLESYRFVYETVRHFFDAHVRRNAAAQQWLDQPLDARRFGPSIVDSMRIEPALPPAPTKDEFAALLAADVDRAARVFRAARQRDPHVRLVAQRTLRLHAFRARRAENHEAVVTLAQLQTEAFPRSTQAYYDLGQAYVQAGRLRAAEQAFRHALEVLPDDPALDTVEERDASREQIQTELKELEVQ